MDPRLRQQGRERAGEGKKGVRNLFCEAPRPARAVSPTATGKRFLTPFSPGAVHSPA